ncbi:MAG: hypothetical protein M1818_001073 [Claussenomyces sp. TS43310]|nr:MAG: hypothetical protein M1818_001073 [Claussenomyces sp. TS43310]
MTSPFPKSSSAPGQGCLEVQLLPNDISGLAAIAYQYPLKLISPSPTANQKSVLVFLLSYGGGLVGGDQVSLKVTVKPKARLSIVTQGHTKIFKSASREVVTRQKLDVMIERGAAMCLLPDPVQPFDGSVYEQLQSFTLADEASICLLDWVCRGRSARGEDWDLTAWKGRNEIWLAEEAVKKARLMLRDNIILCNEESESTDKDLKQRMHGLGLLGTLILKGPLVESLAKFFMAEFTAMPRIGSRDFNSLSNVIKERETELDVLQTCRAHRLTQEKNDGVLWSVAKVRGCTVVKFAARTIEGGRCWIGSMLKQEGGIDRAFGEDAMMCIR